MANHSATKKDARQAAKRTERNKYYGKTTRNAIRDLKEIKEKGEAGKKLLAVTSMIDKLAKRGIKSIMPEECYSNPDYEWSKAMGKQ